MYLGPFVSKTVSNELLGWTENWEKRIHDSLSRYVFVSTTLGQEYPN